MPTPEPVASYPFPADAPAAAPAQPVAAPVAVAPVAPHETQATVAQPDPTTAAGELAGIAGAGGNSTVTLVLAALAVLGGGAAWKTYQGMSERKHEREMEKMKLDAAQSGANGAQPPPCQAANLALEQKINALTASVEGVSAKVAALEKKSASISADFDPDDVERQLKRLAKAVKTLQEDANGTR